MQEPMKIYDVKELAEYLKVSTRTIQNYIRDGKIKGKKLGRKWIFTEETIRELLKPEK